MTEVASPFTGTVISLDDVNDEVFSERVMGEGVAVMPSDGRVVAPVTGTVAKLFEGGHGFAVETSEGLQILVHVGLETVHLKGDGFTVRAREGQEISAGEEIVNVDLERMTELNIDLVSPVIVISGEAATVIASTEVKAGDPLLEVQPASPD